MSGSALLAGALLGTAVACALRRPRPRRPDDVLPGRAAAPEAEATRREDLPARVACLVAAGAAVVLLPLPWGLPAALAIALGGPRVLAVLEPASVRQEREQLRADLPLVLDLLGACLAGGAALPAAAAAVGDAVPGPAGQRLRSVAAALAVGTPPAVAWLAMAGGAPDTDPLGPAGRTLARAADSGAPVADVLARLSDDARSESRAAGAEAARRAGVLAVAPLGLCFLPAFVLLGVVPVVVGLAGPVLGQR